MVKDTKWTNKCEKKINERAGKEKQRKITRHLFQCLSFLDMHIIHRKVQKSAQKNRYTQFSKCYVSKLSPKILITSVFDSEKQLFTMVLCSAPRLFIHFYMGGMKLIFLLQTLTVDGNRWNFLFLFLLRPRFGRWIFSSHFLLLFSCKRCTKSQTPGFSKDGGT